MDCKLIRICKIIRSLGTMKSKGTTLRQCAMKFYVNSVPSSLQSGDTSSNLSIPSFVHTRSVEPYQSVEVVAGEEGDGANCGKR